MKAVDALGQSKVMKKLRGYNFNHRLRLVNYDPVYFCHNCSCQGHVLDALGHKEPVYPKWLGGVRQC